jgi:hypothetical protein
VRQSRRYSGSSARPHGYRSGSERCATRRRPSSPWQRGSLALTRRRAAGSPSGATRPAAPRHVRHGSPALGLREVLRHAPMRAAGREPHEASTRAARPDPPDPARPGLCERRRKHAPGRRVVAGRVLETHDERTPLDTNDLTYTPGDGELIAPREREAEAPDVPCTARLHPNPPAVSHRQRAEHDDVAACRGDHLHRCSDRRMDRRDRDARRLFARGHGDGPRGA